MYWSIKRRKDNRTRTLSDEIFFSFFSLMTISLTLMKRTFLLITEISSQGVFSLFFFSVDTDTFICCIEMHRTLRFLSFLLWLIRSFFSLWIRLGFRLIYGNQKSKLPPIKDQILLQPATVIAKRIRERQVLIYL